MAKDGIIEQLEKIPAGPAIVPPDGSAHIRVLDHEAADGPVAVIQDRYAVKQLPKRMEGKVCHRFHTIDALCSWLKMHGNAETEILVGPKEVCAILEPERQFPDNVTCSLTVHPFLQDWIAATQEAEVTAQELFRMTMIDPGRIHGVRPGEFSGEDLLAKLGNIAPEAKLTRTEEFDEAGNRTVISSDGKKRLPVSLPPSFIVAGSPYIECITVQNFRFWLYTDISNSMEAVSVSFRLRCPAEDIHFLSAREGVADVIKFALDGMPDDKRPQVYVGTAVHETRPVVVVGDPVTVSSRTDMYT